MNILVIGNGFDLAHGLPTKYGDFLEFCERVRRIYTLDITVSTKDYRHRNLDNWKMNTYVRGILLVAFHERGNKTTFNDDGTYNMEFTTSNKFLNELYSHIDKNTWLDYFIKCKSFIGENWIDFEAEISKVIQILDEAIVMTKSGKPLNEMPKEKHSILIEVHKASRGSMQKVFKDDATLNDFAVFLDAELGRLIRALEIYIVKFVGGIKIEKRNIDIEKINPDHILSFNYSDTYERIYGERGGFECDYIHGKADINKNVKSSNLVLGIDEYLDDDKKDKELELLSFKKFYQRIYKSTGNRYLDWVDEIKDGYVNYLKKESDAYTEIVEAIKDGSFNNFLCEKRYHEKLSNIKCPKHMLYIFGHSLDITDRDILKLFICNDNVQTKIFYYRKDEEDKTELGKLIRNLILIMGQEELIRRTGGAHKTIEFVPQTL